MSTPSEPQHRSVEALTNPPRPHRAKIAIQLWWGILLTPLGLGLLACYGLWRAPHASESELIGFSLALLVTLLFPRLRSRLLRRRAHVNVWIQRGHPLRRWLQGGSLYLVFQMLLAIPVSLILLVELQHLSGSLWRDFIVLGAFCGGARLLIHARLSRVLKRQAASVIAREWTVYLFLLIASLVMLNHTLYANRPNFDNRTLSEALLFTAQTSPAERGGAIRELMFLSTLKETAFWWSVIKLPIALKGLPEVVIWLSRSMLVLIYALYQLSVLFALSQFVAGMLDLIDRDFYTFIRGSRPSKE